MWPRLSSRFVARWIGVTVVLSIVAAIDGGFLVHWCSLAPEHVWRGQVWRLVTWPLVEQGATSLIVTCVAIYKFGGELAAVWGDRRLRRFVIEILTGAAMATCIVARLAGATYVHRLGGWAVADVLAIAWARQFPERVLVLYGLLHMRGRDLVRMLLAVNVVVAIFAGPITMAPELVACFWAAAYPRSRLRA